MYLICLYLNHKGTSDFNFLLTVRIKPHLSPVIKYDLYNKRLLKIKLPQQCLLAVVWFHVEGVMFGTLCFLPTMCFLM